MAALPLIFLIMSFFVLFIIVWLTLSAYCVSVGTAGLIPSIIARKRPGSLILIFSSAAQILSGIALAFSCVYLIISISSSSGNEYNGSEAATPPAGFKLFLTALIISLVLALLASLVGAILGIIRTVKSRKGRTIPKSLTVAASLTAVPSALVFGVFAIFTLMAVFSL